MYHLMYLDVLSSVNARVSLFVAHLRWTWRKGEVSDGSAAW